MTDKHSGLERALDKGQDAAGAAVGKASAALTGGSDASFVKNAALGDFYEIQAGKIAQQRAHSEPVRSLADAMIRDHADAVKKLNTTAASSGHSEHMVKELDARRQSMIDNLNAAPDDEFDETYLKQQYAAHDEATTLFRNYSENGDDSALRSYAAHMLPVLERHFDQVKAVRGD